jgi:hypothetical protein
MPSQPTPCICTAGPGAPGQRWSRPLRRCPIPSIGMSPRTRVCAAMARSEAIARPGPDVGVDSLRRVPPPAGVIALAPGAALMGKSRAGVIEVKAGPSFLVVATEPGTKLRRVNSQPAADGWHVTIHRDLMVHARSRDRRTVVPLLGTQSRAHTTDGVLLLRVTTAPEPHRVVSERQQNTWEGAAIFSPLPDELYNSASTVLALELWAVPVGCSAGRLPPYDPAARPARDRTSRLEIGPVPAAHAFGAESAPAVAFYYVYWWVESTDDSATIDAPGTCVAL